MRRRVALAVVISVVAALVLAGIGTLVLSRAASRRSAERQLRDQAAAVADLVASLGSASNPDGTRPPRVSVATLRRIAAAMPHREGELQDIGLVVIGPAGRTYGELPADVPMSSAAGDIARSGGEASGAASRGRIFGVAGRAVGASTIVVGVTGTTRPLFSGPATWFLVSSGLVVALATAFAWWLGSRLARPIREATEVTRRIASGDLAARLPDPAPGDEDETAVLARSVNTMADALARSRTLEQQFLMSVSHDLRTPLTNIRGYAEAITDGATSPQDGARVIVRESNRLDRLVRDLLDLARLDARQFTLHPVTVPLDEVIRDAAESHRAEISGASLGLEVHVDSGAQVVVDVDRLGQVVGNLIDNAARYATTTVRVRAGSDAHSAFVEVHDDGRGIPPADQPHVFERLYQAQEQPRRTESGSGLGLAIVRELVAAMDGDVGVSSAPEGGTTFWFRLPTARS
ncbi:MAG: HAMP domain-containing histidine kinase [Actinobacteria bacterium]|nr:HAMP domain-containing histidine kinase [Actinomycetota bacterium]